MLFGCWFSWSCTAPKQCIPPWQESMEKTFRKCTWLDSRGWMESKKCPFEKDTAPLSRFICGGRPMHQHNKPSRFVLWSGLEQTRTKNKSCRVKLCNTTTGSERMECKSGFNSIRLLTTDTQWLHSDVKISKGRDVLLRGILKDVCLRVKTGHDYFPQIGLYSRDFFNRPDSEEDKTWAIENYWDRRPRLRQRHHNDSDAQIVWLNRNRFMSTTLEGIHVWIQHCLRGVI